MSTYMPKKGEVERKWYVLGRRGKTDGQSSGTGSESASRQE